MFVVVVLVVPARQGKGPKVVWWWLLRCGGFDRLAYLRLLVPVGAPQFLRRRAANSY
jgi:hypothetical protein